MLLLLLAGCDNPDAAKLTGRYSLESATSAQWTNGATLTPPAVTGVMVLDQGRFGIDGAFGSARMELILSSGPASGESVNWSGNYSNHADGEMRMRLNEIRFVGEHVLDDDVLTITLSGELSGPGPSPLGTHVWRREAETSER